MVEFIIDPEFRDKIPAMPQEDFDGLRADIIRDGYVRDPLVVWKEENILLDGHHRWRVIQEKPETLGDKFKVDYKSFPDRWAAIAWICANQLHKHNMTELQRMKLIQEEHDARQKTVGGQVGNKNAQKQSGEIHHFVSDEPEIVKRGSEGKELKTRPTIAREHGITESEVKSAVEVGRGIDRAAKVDPDFKREVLSGEVKAKKSDLAALRKLESDEEVKAAVEEIRKPKEKRERKPNPEAKQTKELYAKIRDLDAQMASAVGTITFDDVIADLNTIEDDFLNKIERVLDNQRTLLMADERWPDAIEGYFDSVIADITEMKGKVLK